MPPKQKGSGNKKADQKKVRACVRGICQSLWAGLD